LGELVIFSPGAYELKIYGSIYGDANTDLLGIPFFPD
jgi:hypothetical protein